MIFGCLSEVYEKETFVFAYNCVTNFHIHFLPKTRTCLLKPEEDTLSYQPVLGFSKCKSVNSNKNQKNELITALTDVPPVARRLKRHRPEDLLK
jgi:hypothetical protein